MELGSSVAELEKADGTKETNADVSRAFLLSSAAVC